MENLNTIGQQGVFRIRILDAKGNTKQDWTEDTNTAVDQGLKYMMDVSFGRGPSVISPITNWYVGVYSTGGLVTDNLKNITASTVAASVSEIPDSAYTETGRQALIINDATGINDTDRAMSNSNSPAIFTFSATYNVTGAFIVSESVSQGVAGTATLFSIANFTTAKSAASGDILQVVYDNTISSTPTV